MRVVKWPSVIFNVHVEQSNFKFNGPNRLSNNYGRGPFDNPCLDLLQSGPAWIAVAKFARAKGRMERHAPHVQLENEFIAILTRVVSRPRTTPLDPPVSIDLIQADLDKGDNFKKYSPLHI